MKTGDRVGDYVLREKLGEGGFGEVWKAEHAELPGRVVAVKIPTDPAYVAALRREARIECALDHPNIVRTITLNTSADPPYFVMEYVPGESLRARLDREGKLAPEVAVRVLCDVLAGLDAAHAAGVVHRDIKPGNILLGTEGQARVADFGLGAIDKQVAESLQVSAARSAAANRSIAGTFHYMSPEQARGEDGDARTDIYACGVLLHEMLAGRVQPIKLPLRNAPSLLSDVIERAIEVSPEQRFRSAREMRVVLCQDLERKGPNQSECTFTNSASVGLRSAETDAPIDAWCSDAEAFLKQPGLCVRPFVLLFFGLLTLHISTVVTLVRVSRRHKQLSALYIRIAGLFGGGSTETTGREDPSSSMGAVVGWLLPMIVALVGAVWGMYVLVARPFYCMGQVWVGEDKSRVNAWRCRVGGETWSPDAFDLTDQVRAGGWGYYCRDHRHAPDGGDRGATILPDYPQLYATQPCYDSSTNQGQESLLIAAALFALVLNLLFFSHLIRWGGRQRRNASILAPVAIPWREASHPSSMPRHLSFQSPGRAMWTGLIFLVSLGLSYFSLGGWPVLFLPLIVGTKSNNRARFDCSVLGALIGGVRHSLKTVPR